MPSEWHYSRETWPSYSISGMICCPSRSTATNPPQAFFGYFCPTFAFKFVNVHVIDLMLELEKRSFRILITCKYRNIFLAISDLWKSEIALLDFNRKNQIQGFSFFLFLIHFFFINKWKCGNIFFIYIEFGKKESQFWCFIW